MAAGGRSSLLGSSPDDRAKLSRIKLIMSAVLVGTVVLLVIARSLEGRHPAFGFVAAFAEAATIGGLADWYAVVALFRKPLGLPIPHTAIIPSNQGRIADKLGEFIEDHFLRPAPVEARLDEVDFAAFVSDWLADRRRCESLARFVLKLLPEAMAAAESSGLKTFLGRAALAQLKSIDFTPLVAGALKAFVSDRGHQRLLDDLMAAAHAAMDKPETLGAIREKIRDELPTLLKVYRADAYVMRKVAASAAAFFENVRTHPDHPIRGEFDRLALSLIDQVETDPAVRAKLSALEREVLSRPEMSDLADRLWNAIKAFVGRSAAGETRVAETRVAQLLHHAGGQLSEDPELRAEINHGAAKAAARLVTDHKADVSAFIADQVKSWDMSQFIDVIEVNVGRDLQYIRLNGALIGGLAGLVLHTGEILLRL
jgi:uncharacterized membrane-anchored protein YjiN (DUF445 family)